MTFLKSEAANRNAAYSVLARESGVTMVGRLVEIVVYTLLGVAAVWAGATRASTSYGLFLYLMAAMVFLALFRPRKLP